VKGKKTAMNKTKKTSTKKKKTLETIEDPEDTNKNTVLAVTKVTSKQKLVLGGGGTTLKKVRGTLTKFLQTEEQISLMEEKLKDHSMTVWEDIDSAQREMLTGVAERISELR